jgi:hypothetical protein
VELASRAQSDGTFVALRGFEWTSPRQGHMNVWFSTHWTDSVSTNGFRHGDDHVPMFPPAATRRFRPNSRNARRSHRSARPASPHPGTRPLATALPWRRRGALWAFRTHGRTGIWVRELTPAGVREALLARRVFATRQRGFRLDAAANGVRMGGRLEHPGGPIHVVLDIDGGKASWGRRLTVQLLGHGNVVPSVLWTGSVTVPRHNQPPLHFDVDVARDATPWLVIRIGDPDVAQPSEADQAHAMGEAAVAYSSPFFLTVGR